MASVAVAGPPLSGSNVNNVDLLSKIIRSPSRRTRPESDQFNGSPKKTPVFHQRPGFSRNTTAPAATVTLDTLKTASDVLHLSTKLTSDMLGASSLHPVLPQSVPALKSVQQSTSEPASAYGQVQSMPVPVAAGQVSNTLYHNIQETSNKRISTLDYMRKAHEGRIFWFNAVRFTKADVSKMPSYMPNRLSRRATNYLLLGMSLPAVVDIHQPPHPSSPASAFTTIAQEYLRSLNNLLAEFESYQQLHPVDGSATNSLTRARIPQMFKRATGSSRPRKSSGAPINEIGAPMLPSTSPPALPEGAHHHAVNPSVDTTVTSATFSSSTATLVNSPPSLTPSNSFPTVSSFPQPGPSDAHNSTLLQNEGPYTYLVTPPLPFIPDFYVVFATLCDVLIDVYQKLLRLMKNPAVCTTAIGEMFAKVDARIRKVMVGGIVREFESTARDNAKKEFVGIQRVVLGGLMGS